MRHSTTSTRTGSETRRHNPGSVIRAAVAVLAVCLVAVAAFASSVTADSDRQDTKWHINDDPSLEGPSGGWWRRTAGGAYGDYHYTYGIGNSSNRDNYAVWDMGRRNGEQWVVAWVPKTPADVRATVSYRIYRNGDLHRTVKVDQGQNKHWVVLGKFEFLGADVRIEVWDNETREHYTRRNPSLSRIGIDAIAMKCAGNCDDDSLTPTAGQSAQPAYPPTEEGYRQWITERVVPGMEWRGKVNPCDLDAGDWPADWQLASATRTRDPETGAQVAWTYDRAFLGTASHGNTGVLYHFFAGECTSWVQFRLRVDGIPFYNGYRWNVAGPWGHASNWDEAARKLGLLTSTPRKGSVAQWDHNHGGHVAYVEEVLNNGNTIRVSEMNVSSSEVCHFSTRLIHKNVDDPRGVVYNWPHNFIDFSQS